MTEELTCWSGGRAEQAASPHPSAPGHGLDSSGSHRRRGGSRTCPTGGERSAADSSVAGLDHRRDGNPNMRCGGDLFLFPPLISRHISFACHFVVSFSPSRPSDHSPRSRNQLFFPLNLLLLLFSPPERNCRDQRERCIILSLPDHRSRRCTAAADDREEKADAFTFPDNV